ncbi:MAG: hypothetical protein GDA36_07525, partial [Rhodobacteraceae bacterium]|nr:hypothetical protein [Paracoccaceae bacterium]
MSRRFTNTSRAGLCLLGTADQRVHETIVAEVEQALGPAHAAIFAEPEYLHRTASSDWYSSVQGVITPLKDMVEADAVRTRQRLKGMFGDIARHADALNNSRSDRDRHLGTALEQAIRYPSEASVFGAVQADGSIQPIVVDWACEPDVNSRAESTLSGTVAALPGDAGSGTPADPEPVAARAAVTWWWALVPMWLAAAGLAATLAWLLIAPCGLGLGPWANACPKQDIAHADALL